MFLICSVPLIQSASVSLQVQRIPDYEQYLCSLLAETDPAHPDYDDLNKAVTKVKNVSTHDFRTQWVFSSNFPRRFCQCGQWTQLKVHTNKPGSRQDLNVKT